MKKFRYLIFACLIVVLALALVACNNDGGTTELPDNGGEIGGDTGGETGGDTDGATSSDTDGETGGDTDGEKGGDNDGETGGETGGDTDGEEKPVYDEGDIEYYLYNLEQYDIYPVQFRKTDLSDFAESATWGFTVGENSFTQENGEQLACFCVEDEAEMQTFIEQFGGIYEVTRVEGNVFVSGTPWIVDIVCTGESDRQPGDFLGTEGKAQYDALNEDGFVLDLDSYTAADGMDNYVIYAHSHIYGEGRVYLMDEGENPDDIIQSLIDKTSYYFYVVRSGNVLHYSSVMNAVDYLKHVCGEDADIEYYESPTYTAKNTLVALADYEDAVRANFDYVEVSAGSTYYEEALNVYYTERITARKTGSTEYLTIVKLTDESTVDWIINELDLEIADMGNDVVIVGTPWAVSVARGEKDDSLLGQYAVTLGVDGILSALENDISGVYIYFGLLLAKAYIETDSSFNIVINSDENAEVNILYRYYVKRNGIMIFDNTPETLEKILKTGESIVDVYDVYAAGWDALASDSKMSGYVSALENAGIDYVVNEADISSDTTALGVNYSEYGFKGVFKDQEYLKIEYYSDPSVAATEASQYDGWLTCRADGNYLITGTPWIVDTVTGIVPTAEKDKFLDNVDEDVFNEFIALTGSDALCVFNRLDADDFGAENAYSFYIGGNDEISFRYGTGSSQVAVFEFADSESATNFIDSTEVASVVSDFANRIYLYGNMVIIGTISYEIMTQVYGLYPGMTCYQVL